MVFGYGPGEDPTDEVAMTPEAIDVEDGEPELKGPILGRVLKEGMIKVVELIEFVYVNGLDLEYFECLEWLRWIDRVPVIVGGTADPVGQILLVVFWKWGIELTTTPPPLDMLVPKEIPTFEARLDVLLCVKLD